AGGSQAVCETVSGALRTSTWAPGCPRAARKSVGLAGCGGVAGFGAALAHPATAAAARIRTAIRFMSIGRGGRLPSSYSSEVLLRRRPLSRRLPVRCPPGHQQDDLG